MGGGRYAIGDLARLSGVSRRAIRYYVEQRLLPAPLGRGRGKHYDDDHLERILRIKALQERGLALEQIRTALDEISNNSTVMESSAPPATLESAPRFEVPAFTRAISSSRDHVLRFELQGVDEDVSAKRGDRPRTRSAPPASLSPDAARQTEMFGLAAREAIRNLGAPARSAWTRLELGPGIELHVASDRRVPPPGRVRELARWCRREFGFNSPRHRRTEAERGETE